MKSRIAAVGVCLLVVLSMAQAAQAISLYISTTTTVDIGLNDLTIRQGDVALFNTATEMATLAFSRDNFRTSGGVPGASGNVDAFDVLPDGSFLISTGAIEHLGSNLVKVRPGDIVQYFPLTDTASIYFDQDTFRTSGGNLKGSGNVDAIQVLPNGNILMSVAGTGRLGAPMLVFKDGDLVEYDPINDTASLYLSESVFRKSNGLTGADVDVDGVGLLNSSTLLLSTRGGGFLGQPLLTYRDGDIVAYNTTLDTAWVYFSEDQLHCSGQDIDALAVLGSANPAPPEIVPEPLTICAAAMGLVGLGGYLRRRNAAA